MYKLQLSCIGLRLLSLSPPVTCCPRTAEATRNGIETTALGIVRALEPRIAQGRVCLCSTLTAWPRGIACHPWTPFLSLQIKKQQKKPRYLDPFFLAAMAVGSCLGPQKMRGSTGELQIPPPRIPPCHSVSLR